MRIQLFTAQTKQTVKEGAKSFFFTNSYGETGFDKS